MTDTKIYGIDHLKLKQNKLFLIRNSKSYEFLVT